MNPFFSIITPVYNCKRFIHKCIESVINQTYESWELILIDDGSTDTSGEICDSFMYDSRIKVIHQKNSGNLTSRINGISIATGEYELGLDADDYLDKRCLEKIKEAIDFSNSDLIFFGFRYVGDAKGVVKCSLESGKKYSRREILEEVILKTNHSLWNKAIKLEKVKQASLINLKRKLSINLDYIHIIPILCKIDQGYVMEDVLYNYRVYGTSMSHVCKVEHIYDTGRVTEYIARKLLESEIMDSNLYNMIYIAYLKMIGFRLENLFDNEKITLKDCQRIHKSRVYIKSKKVEKLENLRLRDFVVLKCFRYRQYWIIKLMLKLNK